MCNRKILLVLQVRSSYDRILSFTDEDDNDDDEEGIRSSRYVDDVVDDDEDDVRRDGGGRVFLAIETYIFGPNSYTVIIGRVDGEEKEEK